MISGQFYTIKGLARKFQVSENTIRRMRERGQLIGMKIGRRWRFAPDDVDRFIKKMIEKPKGGTNDEE